MVEVKKKITGDISVGELASRAGVSVAAIHFYERKGLITSIRTGGNQRRFARAMLRRVALIQVAKSVGMPLADLATLFKALPDGHTPGQRDWQSLAKLWQADIETRLSILNRLKENLSSCIGCGCLSLKRCRLFNADDQLEPQGPGAVLLQRKAAPTT